MVLSNHKHYRRSRQLLLSSLSYGVRLATSHVRVVRDSLTLPAVYARGVHFFDVFIHTTRSRRPTTRHVAHATPALRAKSRASALLAPAPNR